MVSEADAAMVVTEVMLVLAARGHDVAITRANGPRLVRLGALMLAEFGIGGDSETVEAGND